jgi:hypothetical protein
MDTKALDSAIEFIASTHGGIFMKDAKKASAELVALKARLAEAEEALELIGDIAFDRDGYTGNADKLAELIDELYSYAKNPKKAHFFNYPEVK